MVEVGILGMASTVEKDRAWKKYKILKQVIRDNQITKSQSQRPTEENVQKCMKELQLTSRATKEVKRIGRMLGEPTNTDKFRRPW